MQVIPAINAATFDEARKQAALYRGFLPAGSWIQVDVDDGLFSPKTTWRNPDEFKLIKAESPGLNFEVHLMLQNPKKPADDWMAAGISRVIVHVESNIEPFLILGRCALNRTELMVALKTETPVDRFAPYLSCVSYFQILAVSPGPAGQKFNPIMLEKIRVLRKKAPNAKIEIDGGMTPETARLVKDAGADIIVSASYILNAKDPKRAYEELCRI